MGHLDLVPGQPAVALPDAGLPATAGKKAGSRAREETKGAPCPSSPANSGMDLRAGVMRRARLPPLHLVVASVPDPLAGQFTHTE